MVLSPFAVSGLEKNDLGFVLKIVKLFDVDHPPASRFLLSISVEVSDRYRTLLVIQAGGILCCKSAAQIGGA